MTRYLRLYTLVAKGILALVYGHKLVNVYAVALLLVHLCDAFKHFLIVVGNSLHFLGFKGSFYRRRGLVFCGSCKEVVPCNRPLGFL